VWETRRRLDGRYELAMRRFGWIAFLF